LTESSATRLSLLSRIRHDDGVAWSELVGLYSPLVAYWCRRHGIAGSDIHDLSQEVFFAVSRSIDRYHPTGSSGSFRAWLWSLSRHKMIDWIRRQQRWPRAAGGSKALQATRSIPEDPYSDFEELDSVAEEFKSGPEELVPEQLDESDVSERTAYSRLVHRALAQVRAEFESRSWQAFWRTTIDGLTVASVAEELSMNPATIRQHRSRILRRLRQQLGETT